MSQAPALRKLLPELVALAEDAGRAILEIYAAGVDPGVRYKDDDSPLTKADLASHRVISQGLAALTPDIPVLSEESSAAPYEERRRWELFWMVDPLDGTKEFLNRNGEFTVNIALIRDGAPIVGVVGVPEKRRLYFAAEDTGAFAKAEDGEAAPISTRALGAGPLKVVASRSHAGKETEDFLARLKGRYPALEIVSVGSALKLCQVAEGSAHLYPRFGPTMEWDTAAAQCVVEISGGRVTDLAGQRLAYNKPDLHNPHFIVSGDPALEWAPYL
jgi:3'(2'), 5'-bisphosphate nucleotidase